MIGGFTFTDLLGSSHKLEGALERGPNSKHLVGLQALQGHLVLELLAEASVALGDHEEALEGTPAGWVLGHLGVLGLALGSSTLLLLATLGPPLAL